MVSMVPMGDRPQLNLFKYEAIEYAEYKEQILHVQQTICNLLNQLSKNMLSSPFTLFIVHLVKLF